MGNHIQDIPWQDTWPHDNGVNFRLLLLLRK